MSSEKKEKRILRISFGVGLVFAVSEFIFAIYSHSQSSLMDAAYDATELIFIALILFLTPLFYKPITEKRPYGFFQIESIFLVVKGFMMLSVTGSILVPVLESTLAGGNSVDGKLIALFQLGLGTASLLVFFVMRTLNKSITSPIIKGEMLSWRIDIAYSFGMSLAFFLSSFLEGTALAGIAPYFDQIIAVAISVFMLPKILRMLWTVIKDVFLFAPSEDTVNKIKSVSLDIMAPYCFEAKFFDITRTGRHLWVSIYFTISEAYLSVEMLQVASAQLNEALGTHYDHCTCELILLPNA